MNEVQISNLAVSHLGEDANISAINPPENSALAQYCSIWYPAARDALLEMHNWRFAAKRTALTQLSTTPVGAFTYGYQLPDDCIAPRVVLFPDSTDDTTGQPFTVELDGDDNAILYTNVDQAVLLWTKRITDTAKFTPWFSMALARLLSSYLAGPVIKGMEGMQVAAKHFEIFGKLGMPAARANDSNARQSNPYTTAIPESIAVRA